jgi:hypothetical protein
MSSNGFLEGTVTIRGETFTVRELDAKSMREARRIIDTDKHRLEIYVAFKGTVEPKFESEEDLLKRPQIFADKLSAEIFRLTKVDDEKNV